MTQSQIPSDFWLQWQYVGDGGDRGPGEGGRGGRGTSGVSNLVFFGDSLTDNGNLYAATGYPGAPWWNGRFSNGPTYAEQLPALLGVAAAHVQNYAYGGGTAAGSTFRDLDAQVQDFISSLKGGKAAPGTEAVLYIGNNDYLNYDPSTGQPPPVAAVMAHIQAAIGTLVQHGVGRIVLFTLPDFSVTPAGQALEQVSPATVAGADAIIDASNAALKALAAEEAAAGVDVKIVDAAVLASAVSADGHAFGFKDLSIPIITGANDTPTGISSIYAPNEIAFFNDIHPTYATHGVQAAFAAATLQSDTVELFTNGGNTYAAPDGSAFIFAVAGGNSIHGGSGDDVIYAGDGSNTVHGGGGTDLIFAGGGDNQLTAGNGVDLLAVGTGDLGLNSGNNVLVGGHGEDILVANRQVTNTLDAYGRDNLVVLKEDAGAGFAAETIAAHGDTTLRFIINDQNPAAEQALVAEFAKVSAAFEASWRGGHAGTFSVDGLTVSGVTGLQLQIDSVDSANPYQIDHTIAQSVGQSPELSWAATQLVQQASLWGVMTA